MEEENIKEGFICPVCMKEFSIPAQLQTHFEDLHSEDHDALRQIRGMFRKTKKKILKKIDSESQDSISELPQDEGDGSNTVHRGTDPFLWDYLEFGASRSHFRQFKERRDAEIDRYVVETNKILIRLEKLLRSGVHVPDSPLPGNFSRKTKEKSLVPWIADSEVKFCPICKKQFNVARRRHHCRLCGGIMCGKCSKSITVPFAVQLLKLDKTSDIPRGKGRSRDDADEAGFRSCQVCADLLYRHEKQEKEKQIKPAIVQLYEKMKECMAEAEKLCPVYIKMADSLNLGDIQYDLDEAAEIRIKLIKRYEKVDLISKKIGTLGSQGDTPPSAQFLKLQRGMRAFATGYLQENMFTLPNLPPRDKVAQLQQERAAYMAARAAEEKAERERAMQRRLESSKVHQRQNSGDFRHDPANSRVTRQRSGSQVGEGWGPVSLNNVDSSPDPILQQMEIIRNYIKQAKQAKRLDEVQTLEKNLLELEAEYNKNQQ
ncbi:rabenosyn-5-like [Actinia tenebrosa]|uniref:Rabenosyn-5-like n=1 Tax=Actinia tenebrosa TaxID=6105 RepID=A0A6P8IV01_ACTTE|nr:rabenosyn-5-like [Actinia tenebrosa]